MKEDFDKYLAVANHDIQMAKNMGELKSYVASILYDNDKKIDMIHELEEEIKEHQKALDETTSEKIDLDNIIKETSEDLHQVVKWCTENKHNENTIKRYLVVDYGTIVGKINEIRTKLDKGE